MRQRSAPFAEAQTLMGKHYCVTGGAGFIGSNLTDALIDAGNKVTVIDNLATGKREQINSNAIFINADICDTSGLIKVLQDIDGVFHCAALPRVQRSITNPIETNNANVSGTLSVLWAAKEAHVKRVVYSASSSAYGAQSTMPLEESMRPNPMSPYGLQKYIGEEYARLFAALYGLETVSLRYFNVYGPRMAGTGEYCTVMKIFMNQKAAGKPMTIRGKGIQRRAFTHVADVVRANMLAMESTRVGLGEVMNIGANKNYSVNEVAAIIGGPTVHVAAVVEPHETLADGTRAKKLLGWEPKENFDIAMKKLLAVK